MVVTIKDSERTKCQTWTRGMGFIRPVSNFNIGKRSEYNERVNFTEEKALKTINKG